MKKWIIPLGFMVMIFCPSFIICSNVSMIRLAILSIIILFADYNAFKIEKHHFLIFLWFAWVTLSTIFSNNPMRSFYGFWPYRTDGWLTLVIILAFGSSYWASNDDLKPISWICLISIVCLVISNFVMVSGWQWFYAGPEIARIKFSSYFLTDVSIGAMAAFAGLILMRFHPALGFIALIPIINAGNRSGIIALAVGMVFMLWKAYGWRLKRYSGHLKWIPVLFMSIFAILCLVDTIKIEQKLFKLPSMEFNGARSQWIKQEATALVEMPWTGYGLDNLVEVLRPPEGEENKELSKFINDRTHNVILDTLLMTGWNGLLLLTAALYSAFRIALYKHPSHENMIMASVLIAYIVFGLFNPIGLAGNCLASLCFFGIRKPACDTL